MRQGACGHEARGSGPVRSPDGAGSTGVFIQGDHTASGSKSRCPVDPGDPLPGRRAGLLARNLRPWQRCAVCGPEAGSVHALTLHRPRTAHPFLVPRSLNQASEFFLCTLGVLLIVSIDLTGLESTSRWWSGQAMAMERPDPDPDGSLDR